MAMLLGTAGESIPDSRRRATARRVAARAVPRARPRARPPLARPDRRQLARLRRNRAVERLGRRSARSCRDDAARRISSSNSFVRLRRTRRQRSLSRGVTASPEWQVPAASPETTRPETTLEEAAEARGVRPGVEAPAGCVRPLGDPHLLERRPVVGRALRVEQARRRRRAGTRDPSAGRRSTARSGSTQLPS